MIQQQKKEVLGILRRLKNRDFSGNTGIAVKNSAYNLGTNLVTKIGSILFMVIIARLLLPELFGLFSLALSTIVIISAFADLGMGTALVKFLSKEVSKKNGNPSKYYNYLLKVKFLLTLGASIILLLSAYFLANYYYHKPIFFALLAGSLYLFIVNLLGFFSGLFQAYNDFSKGFYKEILLQVVRLIIVPIVVLSLLNYPQEWLLPGVFVALTISYLFPLLYLFSKKQRYSSSQPTPTEKKAVLKFIFPLSVTGLSGMFFGYVDIIILGRFVESSFIGYYQAALTLVASTVALISFSTALFPIYSQLRGKDLAVFFRKSVKYVALSALLATIGLFFLASIGITLIYGSNYYSSILVLKVLSLVIIID